MMTVPAFHMNASFFCWLALDNLLPLYTLPYTLPYGCFCCCLATITGVFFCLFLLAISFCFFLVYNSFHDDMRGYISKFFRLERLDERWFKKKKRIKKNTSGGTRTHTGRILSPLPLPIGLRSHNHQQHPQWEGRGRPPDERICFTMPYGTNLPPHCGCCNYFFVAIAFAILWRCFFAP